MNAAAPSCCWRGQRERSCTTSARARRNATGAGRRAACCGRGDRAASSEWRNPPLFVSLFATRYSPFATLRNATMNQKNLLEVDWSKIPAPTDDGTTAHLKGMTIPPFGLVATDDSLVTLAA